MYNKKGEDVFVDKNVNITRPQLVNLGNHIAIDYGFHCTTGMEIGDYVHIGPHVSCIGGKTANLVAKGFNNVMGGARLVCGSDRFDDSGLFGALIPEHLKGRQIIKPIIMEEFSNVGTNAVVMPGSRLRKGVLLTAGSLLMGDTEEWGIYKGNPAVLIKKIDGTKIMSNARKLGWRDYKLDGCFMDDEKKFALIHIYKNASISMRNVMNMRGKYHDWDEVKDAGAKTICIIRNPMERVVSSYQYLLRLEDNGFINKHPTHITKETEFFKAKDDPIKSFNLFLDYIQEHGFYDAVTLPQSDFISDRGLKVGDIDEIMIQETLSEDFEKFKTKYGIEGDIKNDNVSDNKVSKLLNEYVESNPRAKAIIVRLYSEDFEIYNMIKDTREFKDE